MSTPITSAELPAIQAKLADQNRRGTARLRRLAGFEPLDSLPCERLAQGLDDPPKDETAPYRVKCEADLHEDILAYCRGRGWIALHGSMAQATGRTLGEWDFVIVAHCGRTFLIECKTATGKLTPEQAGMKAWAEKLGHAPKVVRSMEEFLEATK
jgi:hypothetical protein